MLTLTASSADVSRAHFTSGVVNKEPVNNITKLESSYTSIFFYSDIRDCVGCKIAHEWWYEDEKIHTQRTTAKYKRWRWWSKITPRGRVGEWRVKVIVNGKNKDSRILDYYNPGTTQVAPIQKRLKMQGISNCEKKLEEFHNKVKEHPDDPYYEFMFRKWGTRCFNE